MHYSNVSDISDKRCLVHPAATILGKTYLLTEKIFSGRQGGKSLCYYDNNNSLVKRFVSSAATVGSIDSGLIYRYISLMLFPIEVKTHCRTCLVDITEEVRKAIKKSGIEAGTCIIYVPHTTAAVTINENYDPSVCEDIITTLNRIVPKNGHYAHNEGNADAHIKAAVIGSSKTIFFEKGEILFGTWQGIFFCEFDGPRQRRVLVKILKD